MKRNYMITALFVVVSVATGFGVGWMANDFSKSRQTVEQQTAEILRRNVDNGMSIDDITNLVGQNMLERNYEIPESVRERHLSLWAKRDSGLQPGDEFCAIRIGGFVYTLHFRDAKLINCEPDLDFGDPEKLISGIAG